MYNLIKKHAYITEKELIRLTLMEVLETRASLNKLLEKGLVYFYNENSRTIVYKIANAHILQEKIVDLIASTIMRLDLAAQTLADTVGVMVPVEKVKNKLIEF